MRVLYLINYAGCGGSEKYVYNLINAYNNQKCECFFAYNENGLLAKQIAEMNVVSFKFEMNNPFDLKAAKTLAKICKENKIDIIHAQYPRENCIAILSRLYYNKTKVVFTNHILCENSAVWKMLNTLLCSKSDRIIAVCKYGKELLIKNGYCAKKISVVYNGAQKVSRQKLENALQNNIKKELGLQDDVKIISTVMRLCDVKRPWFLVDAVEKLKTITKENFVCLIAGDGELFQSTKAQIKNNNLEDKIILLGYRNDIPNILCVSDIFTNTSESEALSFAITEALSFGVPCVVTDVGGNKEIINQENNNGFLIEKDDIDGFANSLKMLLEDDILHETFANGAKKSSDEVFSLSASLEKTYEIYTSLLKN